MKLKRLFKSNIFRNGIVSYKKELISGNFGYLILENHLLNKKNLETGRIIIRREAKKKSKIYIRPRLLTPITKKATGIRMGKGKGPIVDNISYLKIDSCLYEVSGIDFKIALKILKKLSFKYAKTYCFS